MTIAIKSLIFLLFFKYETKITNIGPKDKLTGS